VQLKVLKEAIHLLNNGKSFEVINNCLYKAAGFRVVLSKANIAGSAFEVFPINKVISAPNREAIIVVAPKILRDKNIKQPEEEFGMLGKRVTRSNKCGNDSSEDSANS
jgi:hypothetical protein